MWVGNAYAVMPWSWVGWRYATTNVCHESLLLTPLIVHALTMQSGPLAMCMHHAAVLGRTNGHTHKHNYQVSPLADSTCASAIVAPGVGGGGPSSA